MSVKNRHVLGLDDIADTRYTTKVLSEYLALEGPTSLQFLALLSKTSRKEADVVIKYIGFEIPDKFVFGYGIDVNEEQRTMPYIAYMKD